MDDVQNEYQEIINITEEALKERNASNSKKALDTINKAVEIGAGLTSQTTEYAHSLHVRGNIHQDLGMHTESFEDFYQAYRVYSAASNVGSAFHSLWHAGSAASHEGKNDEAKAIFRKCLGNLKDLQITTIQQANFYRVLAIHEERIDNLIASYALWLHCLSLYKDVDIQEAIDESQENINRIREILKEQ